MKRVLYGIFAAGLALSLAGCGDSGGGYWPNTPTQAAGDQQVTLVGNNNAVASKVVLSGNGVSSAVAAGVGACPVMADFGVTLPVSLGGTPIAPAASVLGASRSRTKTDAAAKGMTLTSDSTGFNKFTYKTSGTSYIGSTYSMEYTWYVKFLSSTGSALTLDTTSSSFYAFSGADSSAVNGLEFYGEWIFSSKYTGSSSTSSTQACNVLANYSSSSSSTSSEYTMKGTFGSSSSPCVVTNLLTSSTDAHVYTRYNGSFTTAGTFDGSAYAATITTKTYGDATSGSYTGMFKYPRTQTSTTYSYGYGTFEISDGTTKVEFKADGSTYKIYVNGQAYSN